MGQAEKVGNQQHQKDQYGRTDDRSNRIATGWQLV
jgi:hypothetical protein